LKEKSGDCHNEIETAGFAGGAPGLVRLAARRGRPGGAADRGAPQGPPRVGETKKPLQDVRPTSGRGRPAGDEVRPFARTLKEPDGGTGTGR